MDMRWKAARVIVLLGIVELSLGSAAVVCGFVARTKATKVSFFTSTGLFGFYVSKLRSNIINSRFWYIWSLCVLFQTAKHGKINRWMSCFLKTNLLQTDNWWFIKWQNIIEATIVTGQCSLFEILSPGCQFFFTKERRQWRLQLIWWTMKSPARSHPIIHSSQRLSL